MLRFIKYHPFGVKAFFDFSLVLSYAFPKETLQPLLPECFNLSTYKGKWAFLAVALVKTKLLRPDGVPKQLGQNFFLGGYRLFIDYRNQKGIFRRGLYILKSETDKKRMKKAGNIFTQYNYDHQSFIYKKDRELLAIESSDGLSIRVNTLNEQLPVTTPFKSKKEARRFEGPMPYTFSYDQPADKVITVKGVRNKWEPKLVEVLSAKVPFFEKNELKDGRLANAFLTQKINYKWNKGEIEKR